MSRSIVARQSYRWGLPVVALAALLPAAASMSPLAWSGSYVAALALWAALVGWAEGAPLALPRLETSVRLTAAFEFGALLSFGIVPATSLVALGRIAGTLARRGTLGESTRGAARAAVMVGFSGAVYSDQGGAYGPALTGQPFAFAPIALAMAVFALAGAALDAWRSAAESPPGSRRPGAAVLSQGTAALAIALPVGLGFAWLEAASGPAAAACALALLVTAPGRAREPEPAQASPSGARGESEVEIVRLLMTAVDAVDPFTRGLSARIAKCAVLVARHLGVEKEALRDIELGALLHGIGRTAIRLDFLARPGRLEAHERAVLQTHPTIGYETLRTIPTLQAAAEIVYAHHEQPDGRGYPRGLKGEDIPVGSRIILVATAFDAMTRERPYRRGLGAHSAYEELRRNAGTQFFPEVVEAFIHLHRTGRLDREMEDAGGASLPAPAEEVHPSRAAA